MTRATLMTAGSSNILISFVRVIFLVDFDEVIAQNFARRGFRNGVCEHDPPAQFFEGGHLLCHPPLDLRGSEVFEALVEDDVGAGHLPRLPVGARDDGAVFHALVREDDILQLRRGDLKALVP